MEVSELVARLALALGIGLLIGLERGWRSREEAPGSRAAGIRTFALSGLLGGVIGAIGAGMSGSGGGLLTGLSIVAYAAGAAAFCTRENRSQNVYSATTWVAGVFTFSLGVYSIVGNVQVAAGLAVAAAGVLALREPLHGWIEGLSWPELRSGLVLLAMTFIALPIIPERPLGPFGGIQLREVWIIAIILAGASFLGYLAVKHFGATKGILLAGAAGGLASSTAVTIANARRAATGEGSVRILTAGVAMASAVMFLRVFTIIAVINPKLLELLAPPLLAAAAGAASYGLFIGYWSHAAAKASPAIKFRNPLALAPVAGFALLLCVLIVASRLIEKNLGGNWIIASAAVAGLADVDAITVSLAGMTPETLAERHAVVAILVAVAADTISKVVIGGLIGHGRFAASISVLALICVVAGLSAFWATIAVVGWV